MRGTGLLAIPSRGRPRLLVRAAAAWSRVAGGETSWSLLLVDPDRSESELRASIAEAPGPTSAGPIRVAGSGALAALRAGLAAGLPAPAATALGFALGLGPRLGEAGDFGARRNLALLLGAGSLLAMADDDVRPDFREADFRGPDRGPGEPTPTARGDPTRICPCPAGDEAGRWTKAAEESSLARAERLLGPGGDQSAPGGSAGGIARGEPRIAALCFGSYGDSGMGSNRHLILSPDAVVDEALEDAAFPESAATRNMLRAPPRDHAGATVFMGMHCALDLRGLVPPFPPFGRDEDGTWGRALTAMHPEALLAGSSLCVAHRPEPARGAAEIGPESWRLGANELLRTGLVLVASEGRKGYEDIGGALEDLGLRIGEGEAAELERLAALVHEGRMARLEELIERAPPGRELWTEAAEAALGAIAELALGPEPWRPRELDGLSRRSAASLLGGYLAAYGGLLRSWPALFAAAASRAAAPPTSFEEPYLI